MGKTLVAYFSASGVTARLAERLAGVIGADLFEIVPETPYTAADLDWRDANSRSSIEMKDAYSRPATAGVCGNIGEYDTILLGFPIWWYTAPTIINSFLEEHELAGKTIVPFATSGGSGMGRTNESLKKSAPLSTIVEGRVLNGASDAALEAWLKSLGL